jgi:hypothetical protein
MQVADAGGLGQRRRPIDRPRPPGAFAYTEKRAYLEINRLLPDRYQTVDQHELFEDDDTSLEHIEEESDSSARRRRAKQPKLKEDEKGFWLQVRAPDRSAHRAGRSMLSPLCRA